jgi:4-amino-4-deoxy-L-arabinose transferase-like glycosyltransferase
VSNDALAAVVFALLTWLMIRAAPDKIQRWFLLGLMLGAGLLTKAYFVAAVPAVLLLALATLFKTDKRKRSTVLLPVLLSLMLPLLVSGWWYARSLIGPSGIWVDAAPTESVPIGTLLSNSFKMDWWTAAGGAFNAHIWLGGWSFLGIRSWMYNVFRAVFFLSFVGAMVALIRPRTVERRNLLILALLYVGFWLALMYHAFINFVNSGRPATTGYYLYAAVVPEVLILAIGLYSVVPRRLTRLVLAAVASLFVLLEMYATHFVLIPYYTGIIRHNPDGGLPAFHVSQALDIGWGEIVGRMHLNRPELLSLGMFVAIWIAYICSSVLLPVIAPALLDREGHNTNRRQDSQQRPASRKESLSR